MNCMLWIGYSIISRINYPRHKLEVQVLDDSTDESLEATKIRWLLCRNRTWIFNTLQGKRTGFKAGALKEGPNGKGSLSPFLMPISFQIRIGCCKLFLILKMKPLAWFRRVGGISIGNIRFLPGFKLCIDAHFTLEQVGRNSQGHFINFNGTAGIWRKECILDAGNWEGTP